MPVSEKTGQLIERTVFIFEKIITCFEG